MPLPIHLEHFTPDEFRGWYELMDPRLLVLLDAFRHGWGAPVRLSPAAGALGRELDASVTSDHNITRHGCVLAADVMPAGMGTRAASERAIGIARAVGFSAIGLYPHWRPSAGLHLGTRRERTAGDPAVWGALRVDGAQAYCALAQALEACRVEGRG